MTPEERKTLRASMVRGAIDAVREHLNPEDPAYARDQWSEDRPIVEDGEDTYETLSWQGPEVEQEGRRLADEIAGMIRERFPDA